MPFCSQTKGCLQLRGLGKSHQGGGQRSDPNRQRVHSFWGCAVLLVKGQMLPNELKAAALWFLSCFDYQDVCDSMEGLHWPHNGACRYLLWGPRGAYARVMCLCHEGHLLVQQPRWPLGQGCCCSVPTAVQHLQRYAPCDKRTSGKDRHDTPPALLLHGCRQGDPTTSADSPRGLQPHTAGSVLAAWQPAPWLRKNPPQPLDTPISDTKGLMYRCGMEWIQFLNVSETLCL